MNYLTSGEAAKILGITNGRVRQLLIKGTLKGKRFGHIWMVDRRSVERYAASGRKPGPKPLDKR
jgi:excisionase family DNA binding protein